MERKFDIQKSVWLLILSGILLLTTTFFLPEEVALWKIVAGCGFIAFEAWLTYATEKIFSTGLNFALPALFVFLMLGSVNYVYFSHVHISAALFALSLMFTVRYLETLENDNIFIACLLLSAASFFAPSLIWMTPAMITVGISSSEGRFKYVMNGVSGLLTSSVIAFAVLVVKEGFQPALEMLSKFGRETIAISLNLPNVKVVTIFKVLVVTVITICAAVNLIGHSSTYSNLKVACLTRIIIITLLLAVDVALFGLEKKTGMILTIPVSIILFEYLSQEASRRTATVILLFLFIAIASERVALFI